MKIQRHYSLLYMAAISLFLFLGGSQDRRAKALLNPAHHFHNFKFNPKSSLLQRVKPANKILLTHLRVMDSRDDYTSYTPTKKEMAIIERYLKDLPPLSRQVLEERLIGIYFVKNFIGSGMTEWAVDEHGKMYTYMIFSPIVFSMNLSEILTWKESTAFIKDDSQISFKFKSNEKHNGFLYILIHESTHAVDYIKNITPYTDPESKFFMDKFIGETRFSKGIWSKYREPKKFFPYKSRIAFYGLNNGPKLYLSEAEEVYKALGKSPYISLYSLLNWAEDLAELVTFYHLVEVMGLEYAIQVYKKKKLVYTLKPSSNKRVRQRFSTIRPFYLPELLFERNLVN